MFHYANFNKFKGCLSYIESEGGIYLNGELLNFHRRMFNHVGLFLKSENFRMDCSYSGPHIQELKNWPGKPDYEVSFRQFWQGENGKKQLVLEEWFLASQPPFQKIGSNLYIPGSNGVRLERVLLYRGDEIAFVGREIADGNKKEAEIIDFGEKGIFAGLEEERKNLGLYLERIVEEFVR